LIRQLLTESLLLGTLGGVVGLLAGAWLTGLLVRLLPGAVPRVNEISLDFVVATATLVAAVATGMLFGIMPALQASRADAATALKRGGERGSARARARATLVVVEVALTLVLLAGAGLLLNSFLRLQRVDSGLQPENVTLVSLILPETRYPTGAAQTGLYRRVLEGLSARPEVQLAGVGFPGPLRGGSAHGAFHIEGRSSDPADRPMANLGSVSGDYFRVMGVPLLSGRTFTDGDRAEAPPVAIASAALTRKYWPGEDAVGRQIRFDLDSKEPPLTIVGIVGDVRQLGLDQDAPPILYIPYEQFPLPFTNVAVRSTAPENDVAALVRAQLRGIDPELPPGDVTTLQGVIDRSVSEPRFRTALISAFAMVALVLAAVGVYGLISYSVTQRTREIGIRIALGASAEQVLRPMIREGLALALVGTAIGLAGALAGGRVLASFLYGVGTTDPLTFSAVAVVLLGVTLLATYIPSRRALRVDPITALRAE
jgi:putative ABC transport system permease protein